MRKLLYIFLFFSVPVYAQVNIGADGKVHTSSPGANTVTTNQEIQGGYYGAVADLTALNALPAYLKLANSTRVTVLADTSDYIWTGTTFFKIGKADVNRAYVDSKVGLRVPYVGATNNVDINKYRYTADSSYSHRNVTVGDTAITGIFYRFYGYGNSVTAGATINFEFQKWINRVSYAVAMVPYNRGISGTTMSRIAPGDSSAVDRAATMAGPKSIKDRIVLSYGINDSKNSTLYLDTTRFKTSYATVISALLGKGWIKDQMLIQTPTPYYINQPAYVNNEINFVNAAINFAKQNGIRYADTYHALLPYGLSVMSADSLHPNPQGHVIIAQTILKAGNFTPVPTLNVTGRSFLNGQLNVTTGTLDTTVATISTTSNTLLKIEAGPKRGNNITLFGTDTLRNNYANLFRSLTFGSAHLPGTLNLGQGLSADSIPKLILADIPGLYKNKYWMDVTSADGFVFNAGAASKFLMKGSVVVPLANKYILGANVSGTDYYSTAGLRVGTTIIGATSTPGYILTGNSIADAANAPDKAKLFIFGGPGDATSIGLGYSAAAGLEIFANNHPMSLRATNFYFLDNTNTPWMNLQANRLGLGIGSTAAAATLQVGTRVSNGTASNSTIASLGGSAVGGDVYPLTFHNSATATVGNATHLTSLLASGFVPTSDFYSVLTNTNGSTDYVFSLSTGSTPAEKFRISSTGVATGSIFQPNTLQIPNYNATANVLALTNGGSAFPAYNFFQNGFYYTGPQGTGIGLQPYDGSDVAIGLANFTLKGIRLDHLSMPNNTVNSFLVLNASGKTQSFASYSGTTVTFPGTVTATNGVVIPGATSGSATIGVQTNAGTVQFNIPTTNGTAGQALLSGGGSTNPMIWGTLPPTITPNVITASQTASVNNRYYTNATSRIILTLPSTSAVNDVIYIVGVGTGGWQVSQLAGQIVHGNSDTTTGTAGYTQSQQKSNCAELRCVVANSEWTIVNSNGTLAYN